MAPARDLLRLVKFEHTVFALPFAYLGALAAEGGWPTARTGWLILAAMVGARTAAMALNRLVDLPYDRKNPRTRGWELVTGRVKGGEAWLLVLGGAALLGWAAWLLNPLALALSPLALLLLAAYPYTKRWGWWCHLWLGATLAAAPLGGWVAVRGGLPPHLAWIGAGVTLWVAGFDTLYAMQDVKFDRQEGLHSLPALLGEERAFWWARVCHAGALAGFAGFGLALGWGAPWWAGLVVAGSLLVWQHTLVGPGRLERLNAAFFGANGWLSAALLVAAWAATGT